MRFVAHFMKTRHLGDAQPRNLDRQETSVTEEPKRFRTQTDRSEPPHQSCVAPDDLRGAWARQLFPHNVQNAEVRGRLLHVAVPERNVPPAAVPAFETPTSWFWRLVGSFLQRKDPKSP
jgi:hypothetical protein